MKKSISLFLIVISIIILSGCTTNDEDMKVEYIAVKNNLLERSYYEDEIPLDVIVTFDRIDEEEIKYKIELSSQTENMHNIKVLAIHNYNNEEVYPNVGIFNDSEELLTSDTNKKITLTGNITTIKNMSNLELSLKIWIEYLSDAGEKKEIYYQT